MCRFQFALKDWFIHDNLNCILAQFACLSVSMSVCHNIIVAIYLKKQRRLLLPPLQPPPPLPPPLQPQPPPPLSPTTPQPLPLLSLLPCSHYCVRLFRSG